MEQAADLGTIGMMSYIYLGDKHTDSTLRGQRCTAVRRADGKCVRGGSNMLVAFEDGQRVVVLGWLLRKVK